jgi:hypothetical protein
MLIFADPGLFITSDCRCGAQSKVVVNPKGMYRHWCPDCHLGWVVVGSPMDVANELTWCNLLKEEF